MQYIYYIVDIDQFLVMLEPPPEGIKDELLEIIWLYKRGKPIKLDVTYVGTL